LCFALVLGDLISPFPCLAHHIWYQSLGYPLGQASTQTHFPNTNHKTTLLHPRKTEHWHGLTVLEGTTMPPLFCRFSPSGSTLAWPDRAPRHDRTIFDSCCLIRPRPPSSSMTSSMSLEERFEALMRNFEEVRGQNEYLKKQLAKSMSNQ